jgi:hypothetical protein
MGGGQFVAGGNQLKLTFDQNGNPTAAETVDSHGEVRRLFRGGRRPPAQRKRNHSTFASFRSKPAPVSERKITWMRGDLFWCTGGRRTPPNER